MFGASGDDPFGGRPPTSHERMTGRSWDASYQDGPAPWDIGGPQPAVARLVEEGRFTGAVLDVGCGTGDHTVLIAAHGSPVLGVDVADTALARARATAAERGVEAEFVHEDALHLERLGRRFDTLLDCGMFHTLDGDERRDYVVSLAAATEPGGTLHLLCFADGPDAGPHPVTEDELRTAFGPGTGWEIVRLAPDRVHTRFHGDDGAPAWLAEIRRTGG